MNLHTNDVNARLTRYLDRKTMPKRLDGKPMAQTDEIAALVAAVERNAPRDAQRLADWWPLFETRLDEGTGAMWPVVREIIDAAKAVPGAPAPVDLSGKPSMDPAEIAAKRMREGSGYPETALYGILACEIIARGLVDRETMTRCRSDAFLRRRAFYGEESALRWEADRKAAHEDAKVVWTDKSERKQRSFRVPDMTAKPNGAAA